MASNFQRVRNWMQAVKQATPDKHTPFDLDTLELRRRLIFEESEEVFMCLGAMLDGGENSRLNPRHNRELVKELCDLLVVTYGALVALGVDGDVAFQLVMDNNDGKIEHAVHREDGKAIVPDDVKAQLKSEMTNKLQKLLYKEAAL